MATPALSKTPKASFKEILKQQKWLTLIGLPVLLFTTFNGFYSIWGALFIYWGLTSIISGEVYLLEPIERSRNPILFWVILAMWIGFGAMYVLADIYPEYWLY